MHATASAQLHVHVVDDVKELLHAGDLAVDATTKVFAGGSGKQIDGSRIIGQHRRLGQWLQAPSTAGRLLKAIGSFGGKAFE